MIIMENFPVCINLMIEDKSPNNPLSHKCATLCILILMTEVWKGLKVYIKSV